MHRNPATSAAQYGMAQAVLSGASSAMPVDVARELVDKTPARLRSKYARELAKRRATNPPNATATFDSRRSAEAYKRLVEAEGHTATISKSGVLKPKWTVITQLARAGNPYAHDIRARFELGKQ